MFWEVILNRKRLVIIFAILIFLSLMLGFGKIKAYFYYLESVWIFRGNILSRGLSIELMENGQSTQNKVCVALKITNKSCHTYTFPDPVAHRYYVDFISVYDRINSPVEHKFPTVRGQVDHKLDELLVLDSQKVYQTRWINIGEGGLSFNFIKLGKYKIKAEYVFFRDFYWQVYGPYGTWPKHLQNKLWVGRILATPVTITISSPTIGPVSCE